MVQDVKAALVFQREVDAVVIDEHVDYLVAFFTDSIVESRVSIRIL